MLTVFFRTTLLFALTVLVIRAMGKRQLAQLQPFEVVITLMIAELAAVPMGDVGISLFSGVVSILDAALFAQLSPSSPSAASASARSSAASPACSSARARSSWASWSGCALT